MSTGLQHSSVACGLAEGELTPLCGNEICLWASVTALFPAPPWTLPELYRQRSVTALYLARWTCRWTVVVVWFKNRYICELLGFCSRVFVVSVLPGCGTVSDVGSPMFYRHVMRLYIRENRRPHRNMLNNLIWRRDRPNDRHTWKEYY